MHLRSRGLVTLDTVGFCELRAVIDDFLGYVLPVFVGLETEVDVCRGKLVGVELIGRGIDSAWCL